MRHPSVCAFFVSPCRLSPYIRCPGEYSFLSIFGKKLHIPCIQIILPKFGGAFLCKHIANEEARQQHNH